MFRLLDVRGQLVKVLLWFSLLKNPNFSRLSSIPTLMHVNCSVLG